MPKLRPLPYLFLIFVAITMTVGCGQRDGQSAREMYDDYKISYQSMKNDKDVGRLRSISHDVFDIAVMEGNETIAAHSADELIWLYGKSNPEKMIEWSRKAQALYQKLDMPLHAASARIGETKGLYSMRRWNESLESARNYDTTLYIEDADYRYFINTDIANALRWTETKNGDNAHEIIQLLTDIDRDNPDRLTTEDRALLAENLFYIGERDSAFHKIDRALAKDVYVGFKIYPYHIKAEMLMELKDYESACHQFIKAINLTDSLTRANRNGTNNRAEGISEHYELKLETERLALERSRAINVALGLGILLVIVIAIAVVSRIRTRNRQQVAEMSASMARLEADILDSHRISDTMRDRLKALFADRFDTFNEICELWYRNHESAAATADMKRGMEALIARVSDPALADELDALIDSCSDGWMTHLGTACPDLNDDQRRLAGYLFTGFSSESIMILTRRPSVNSVYVAKSRLKKVISDSGAPDTDEILATLSLAKSSTTLQTDKSGKENV